MNVITPRGFARTPVYAQVPTALSIPRDITARYEVVEHAGGWEALQHHPQQLADLFEVLRNLWIDENDILAPGRGKSAIAIELDRELCRRGWREEAFDIALHKVGRAEVYSTHRVDAVKGRVALEVEWNNKDTFFDRDLASFRMLHLGGITDVGIVLTRGSELQAEFDRLSREKGMSGKYGPSTTHMGKLRPKLPAADACPIIAFGITPAVLTRSRLVAA